ncbi:MAG TPA: hypothetical protein PLZ36_09440, partial [Armatimonadota bacterium]|nr:hypothetical protein [Armatimonadota bacterium]
MPITADWHIHTRNSCDQASLTVADLLAGAAALGMTDFGVTDHLHTPVNLPDLVASRAEFDAAAPPPTVHFGVELSSVSRWELDAIATGAHGAPTYGLRDGGPADGPLALGITAEALRALGVEYVVAGAHWPMYVPYEREAIIRDYHRQNLFLAAHPLVTIVAHPWWWMGHWQAEDGSYRAEPWFDDFGAIPASMHDEFAAAALQHGTVVEINLCAQLLHPGYPERYKAQYLDYLAMLKARGVPLSIGSDCHHPRYDIDFPRAEAMLATVGITD